MAEFYAVGSLWETEEPEQRSRGNSRLFSTFEFLELAGLTSFLGGTQTFTTDCQAPGEFICMEEPAISSPGNPRTAGQLCHARFSWPAAATPSARRSPTPSITVRQSKPQKIVLVVAELFVAGVIPLTMFFSRQPAVPMIMSIYVTLGAFLPLAARNPAANRSLLSDSCS